MSAAPPPKAKAGDVIVCSLGHEVGSVLNTIPLALSILVDDVSINHGVPASVPSRYRFLCGQCGRPVARVDDRERWSVRLERGWVR